MKNILITGISGLLGANLAYLLRNRYNIYGVDVLPFSMKNVCFQLGDLLGKSTINSVITEWHPDVVIHCAAAVDVDACEKNPYTATQLNVKVTENIATICKRINARLVFISTDAVYEEKPYGLYKETDDILPVNVYGKTKAAAEDICLSLSSSAVLRTNIYGFNWRNKKSFGEWILYSLIEGKELTMFTDVLFSPILVNDVAEAIHVALTYEISGVYNVCANGSIRKHDFGVYLKQCFQLHTGSIRPISIDDLGLTANRQKNMGMDNEKFSQATGFKFKTPEQSIEEFHRLFISEYPILIKKGI